MVYDNLEFVYFFYLWYYFFMYKRKKGKNFFVKMFYLSITLRFLKLYYMKL